MHTQIARACLAAAVAAAALPAHADDAARLKEIESRLDASLKTIQALQKRVEELEAAKKPTTAPAAGEWGARIENVERSVAQIEAASAAAAQADTGLPIHGFADVGGGLRNAAAAGSAPRGFNVGVFDLYMTPQISAQVKGLVEIAFEYEDSGELAVDVERMQLGYVFSDALTLWAGRFHTPYGYWNTAFHHGAQIQTALSRPRFLEFEDAGGILPAHSVGLWATGGARTGAGRLGYDLYVVNGDAIKAGTLDYQALGDGDGSVGLGFRTQLAVAGSGLVLGLHGLTQRAGGSNADASASGAARVNMLGAYATFDNDDWELMAEYYGFRNRDLAGSGSHGSNAWYAQAGYNLGESFTPYARYERSSLAAADPYFALQENGRSYRRTVAGLRYNVSPKSALKAEWMRTTQDGVDGTPSSLALQYSVRF
ncbi:MAG: hypothetical protein U1F50_19725 [Rubrivivax sp.]